MDNLQTIRRPTYKEKRLIELLVEISDLHLSYDWKEKLMVRSMNDGGMGSLYLFPNGIDREKRIMGKQVSNFQFKDKDGVDVLVALNIDKNGGLFELDIWKTDFQEIIELPDL